MADPPSTPALFLYGYLAQRHNLYQEIYSTSNLHNDLRSNHKFQAAKYFANEQSFLAQIYGVYNGPRSNEDTRGVPVYGIIITGLNRDALRYLYLNYFGGQERGQFSIKTVYTMCSHGSEHQRAALIYLERPPQGFPPLDGLSNPTPAEDQQHQASVGPVAHQRRDVEDQQQNNDSSSSNLSNGS